MNPLYKGWFALPLTAVLLSFATPAFSQQAGLVNVDLRNARVLTHVADRLNINVSNVPITVQVPVAVAAVVCNVPITVLATAINRGGASCYAQSTNNALTRIVQRVVNLQIQ